VKLVFLCSSLAPGRDGVGDYVRQLANACTAAGHVCLLVALHDKHLAANTPLLQQRNEVRFSASLTWTRRTALLSELLQEFNPHWISWQIVGYGFNPKGILPRAMFPLASVARSWPNHVMLHELWLGIARADPLRQRLVGALQRRNLLAFLHHLGPASLHTTNGAYQLALARRGWPADILPLFGNMPVVPTKRDEAETLLAQLGGSTVPAAPRAMGVIFGTIHPQWKPEVTLAWLRSAAAHSGRKIALFAVGRPGSHGAKLLSQHAYATADVPIISIGAHPPETISQLLHAADFGVATHPWGLIEKSGSTVALLEHGVPVLVPRDDWQSRDGNITGERDPLLRRMQDLKPSEFATWLGSRRTPAPQLPSLATRFVAELSAPEIRGALVA
jgi:hypothetical protein